ncbi:hypothetical protein TIFTF001_028599 [Ficus carica]|uniref:Uncharacterized protein n=1 Tax=Ficus carica TaxID=3494 RepID=A0AA88DRM0_FICCA|nr:hypothetical protein TIFTF001_028599 [Ficus carica]
MSKISGTTPNVIARTMLYLHDYSAAVHLQKEKHLKVIGTPVGCLPRALPSGPGVQMTWSGRLPSVPGRQIGLRRTGAIVTGFTSDVRWWMECCDRLQVRPWSGTAVAREESSDRIKPGQQDPVQGERRRERKRGRERGEERERRPGRPGWGAGVVVAGDGTQVTGDEEDWGEKG